MRLYHKYYRKKNPSNRRASLRGERKEVCEILVRSLGASGAGRRKKNPKRKPGDLIDTFNLLAELNTYVAAGHTEYIPLRDIVSANIDGYLSEDALKYSLSEALRDLSAAQVRVVSQMIADSGGEVSPEERREIDRAASRHPSVRRAKARVVAAEKANEAFRKAIKRGLIDNEEFRLGPERLAAMKAQQKGAKDELGTGKYQPADEKLWSQVKKALEKKYPEKFVPTKLGSRRREEFELLLKMSHKDTPKAEKARIKKRLTTALANRFRTATILEYERLGGREMTRAEIRHREAQRMKELGTPFPLGSGFFGVITSAKGKEKGCQWILFDHDKKIYMQGVSTTKSSASRDVAIAYRVFINLVDLGDEAGWDNIPDADRRWLDDKRPDLSKVVARILMQNINKRRRVSKSTAKWIVSAADIKKYEPESQGEEDVAQSVKNMTLGEERVLPGKKKKYYIHVKKGSGGRFTFWVETPDGKISAKRRTNDSKDVMRKAHMIGGAMVGSGDVTRAISNPSKLKRLENTASKYFRKKNPSLERTPVEPGTIKELTRMFEVPADPEDAYRYGYYAGIIQGIDTCGVQNYLKRRKIRNEFQERLLRAAQETTARLTGTKAPRSGRKRKKASSDISSILSEFDYDE